MRRDVCMAIFFLMALLTFLLYGIDKRRAKRHRWRISEMTLLLFSIVGGVGGLLGMLVFHHKTRKWRFRILVPLFAAMDVALLVWAWL